MRYIKTSELSEIIANLPDAKTYWNERYVVELQPPLETMYSKMDTPEADTAIETTKMYFTKIKGEWHLDFE